MLAVVPVPGPPAAPVAASDPASALLEVLTAGPTTWTALAGFALPLVTGLVTGQTWHPAVKGLMLAALSFAAAVVAELVEAGASGPVDWRAILTGAVITWVVAQVSHGGVWRHTAVARRLQAVTLLPAREPEPGPAPVAVAGRVEVNDRSVAAIRARVTAETPTVRPPPRPPVRGGVPPRPPRYLRDDHDGPTTLPER